MRPAGSFLQGIGEHTAMVRAKGVVVGLIQRIMDAAMAIAFAAIVATVAITMTDIVFRTVSRTTVPFTGNRLTWAVPGLVDLSQLLVMTAAALAIPVAFLYDRHVTIDLIDALLPKPVRIAATVVGGLLSIALVSAFAWYGYGEMLGQAEMNTESATLGIPYVWYWAPLLTGFALSVLAITGNALGGGLERHSEVGSGMDNPNV